MNSISTYRHSELYSEFYIASDKTFSIVQLEEQIVSHGNLITERKDCYVWAM